MQGLRRLKAYEFICTEPYTMGNGRLTHCNIGTQIFGPKKQAEKIVAKHNKAAHPHVLNEGEYLSAEYEASDKRTGGGPQ